MNKLETVFTFVLGAAAGAVVTWGILKPKYERIAQEEIDSVKEVYSKNFKEKVSKELEAGAEAEEDVEEESDDAVDCTEVVKELGYSTFTENEGENMRKIKKTKPYVISPDEFSELEYETATLFYFADKVLADDDDNVIEDVDGLVGLGSLERFGEYEDDSVFVRNDELQTDYEILLDKRNFSDVVK